MSFDTPKLLSIGILGAGRVGTAVARQALQAGYDVSVATAKPSSEIRLIVDIVAPGARAVEAEEASAADVVVIAVPLHKYRTLDPEMLAGKIVIDLMNYWAPIDGRVDDFENDPRTTSEIVQAHLNGASVVKSLNHIGYHELEEDNLPPGAAGRRALALASDSQHAKEIVSSLIDRLGYDAVDAGPLAAGRAFQPGTEIFNGAHTAQEMRELLNVADQPATV